MYKISFMQDEYILETGYMTLCLERTVQDCTLDKLLKG